MPSRSPPPSRAGDGWPGQFLDAEHTYEYCNTIGWFYDNFEHPQRLKLLYVRADWSTGGVEPAADRAFKPEPIRAPACAGRLTPTSSRAHRRGDLRRSTARGLAWTQAYSTAARTAPRWCARSRWWPKLGNDPHNQEIPQNMLEDYGKNRSPRRDRLLLACAQHCAGHRKYGDFFEATRRFGEAMELDTI